MSQLIIYSLLQQWFKTCSGESGEEQGTGPVLRNQQASQEGEAHKHTYHINVAQILDIIKHRKD